MIGLAPGKRGQCGGADDGLCFRGSTKRGHCGRGGRSFGANSGFGVELPSSDLELSCLTQELKHLASKRRGSSAIEV